MEFALLENNASDRKFVELLKKELKKTTRLLTSPPMLIVFPLAEYIEKNKNISITRKKNKGFFDKPLKLAPFIHIEILLNILNNLTQIYHF